VHIDRVFVRNVKAAREVEIISAGSDMVELSGANEAGKSSTLDAVIFALCGTKEVDAEPLRHGEEDGEATVEMGGMVITRRFGGANQRGRLTIKPSGKQGDLDDLISMFSFRPLDIATRRAGEPAKAFRSRVVESLQELAGPEFERALHSVDDEIITAEEARKNAKADLSRCGTLTAVDKPAESPEDQEDLQRQLQEANAWNQEQRDRAAAMARRDEQVQQAEGLVNDLVARLEAARTALNGLVSKVLPEPERERDQGALQARMFAMADARIAAAAFATYQQELTRRGGLAQTANEAEDKLATLRDGRARLIANAKLPIPGITWDDGGVFLDGSPWEQLSSGRRWRTAVDLAIAKQEKDGTALRVLFIREGSLIDRKNFAEITELARTKGYQVWVESVQPHTDNAFEIEEGRVASSPDPF